MNYTTIDDALASPEYKDWLKRKEDQKGQPCCRCGATKDVLVVPVGDWAKFESVCVQCLNIYTRETDVFRQGMRHGWGAGYVEAVRIHNGKSWWRRLFKVAAKRQCREDL